MVLLASSILCWMMVDGIEIVAVIRQLFVAIRVNYYWAGINASISIFIASFKQEVLGKCRQHRRKQKMAFEIFLS
jgi:hypothetical protein